MLDMKNMSKESREAEIDKILAETAKAPYSPKRREAKKSEKPPLAEDRDQMERVEKTPFFQEFSDKPEIDEQTSAEEMSDVKVNEIEMNDYFDELLSEAEAEEEFELYEDKNKFNSCKIIFDIIDVLEAVIIAVFVVMLVFTYVFRSAVVTGESMTPFLNDGDRLLAIAFGRPEPGDIVVINGEGAYLTDADGSVIRKEGIGNNMVKRIIAVGGDTIDFDFENGIVYVNGDALEEPYISEPTTQNYQAFEYPLIIPEGYCFVMGDNRNISKDSRHEDIGLVPEKDIIGKVLLRVYPFDKIGSLK